MCCRCLGMVAPGPNPMSDMSARSGSRFKCVSMGSPPPKTYSRPAGPPPGRVLEPEEPVHPPAAVLLPQQQRDVPAELRHAHAAGVAPGLLEGAELRGVIRRDASRRDGQTQVHIS